MDKCFCIFVFHGSKSAEAQDTIKKFSEKLKTKTNQNFLICYLKENSPSLSEALNYAFNKGYKKINCFPFFVLPGSHIISDIPLIIKNFNEKHPECSINQMPCLAEHDSFVSFIADAIEVKNG